MPRPDLPSTTASPDRNHILEMGPRRLSTRPSLAMSLVLLTATASLVNPQALPSCNSKCGDVHIPYPFGFGDENCHREGFGLVCNDNFNPPRPFFSGGIEILSIDLLQAELRIRTFVGRDCFNKDGSPRNTGIMWANLTGTPSSFSDRRNRFTVTGCDTLVYLNDPSGFGFSTGCVSVCSNMTPLVNGTCSGIGCCQTGIPRGLKYFQAEFRSFYNHTRVWSFNPCSYAFVSADDSFVFNTSFLAADYTYQVIQMPAILDWAIEGNNCTTAKENLTSYACRSANSVCLPSNNGLGYICNCSYGYRGNPYISDGCQDIDECKEIDYACLGTCINTQGSYYCTCPPGTNSSNPKYSICVPIPVSASSMGVVRGLAIGVSGGVSVVLLLGFGAFFHKRLKKRKARRLSEKFFHQNHGLLLEQLITSHADATEKTRIFSLKELEKATDNFDKTRIVGHGGYGMVYKGMLSDQRVVAIKKSKITIQAEATQFINEVAILSYINHRNIVKLYGCCLEAEVPLLVYEFISGGTLSDHLHIWDRVNPLPWDDRLRIATEVASAVAYLHSAASIPIYHRDLKSTNILLDDNLTAKVSDFGTSKSISLNQTHATTAVQGTLGYLDPEYLHSGQVTEKSDVYSLGVILVELLTGENPASQVRTREGRNLINHFTWALRENKLFQVLEASIVKEASKDEITEVALLAERCLRFRGEERPTTKEIEEKLLGLRRSKKKRSIADHGKEHGTLWREMSTIYGGSENTTLGSNSELISSNGASSISSI